MSFFLHFKLHFWFFCLHRTATTGGCFKNHKRNCKNSPHIQHTLEKGLKSTCEWKDISTTRTNKNKDRKYKIIGRTRTARMRTSIPSFVADGILVQRQLLEVLSTEILWVQTLTVERFSSVCLSTPTAYNSRLNRSNLKCDSLHTAQCTHCTSFSYLGMWVVGWFRWHSEQNRYALKVLRQWWITAPQ